MGKQQEKNYKIVKSDINKWKELNEILNQNCALALEIKANNANYYYIEENGKIVADFAIYKEIKWITTRSRIIQNKELFDIILEELKRDFDEIMTIQPVENEEIINYSLNKGANMKRCKWCNLKNEKYIKYHDEEWGVPNFDDKYLFEMLILESFQAGLSWECILNKREAFEKAYDNFDIEKIINYDETKILELSENKNIIRNKIKIKASINNAKVFKNIKEEYQTFYNYLKSYTKDKIIYENDKTTSPLSDAISKDLIKRGMKFVGTTIIYSYLQAIGVINSHEDDCYLYKKGRSE